MSSAIFKWEKPYLRAFLETNSSSLPRRIADAENAISLRTTELRTSSGAELEWQAIEDAMSGLSILKREVKTANQLGEFRALPVSNC